jgi:hypothetical protein
MKSQVCNDWALSRATCCNVLAGRRVQRCGFVRLCFLIVQRISALAPQFARSPVVSIRATGAQARWPEPVIHMGSGGLLLDRLFAAAGGPRHDGPQSAQERGAFRRTLY